MRSIDLSVCGGAAEERLLRELAERADNKNGEDRQRNNGCVLLIYASAHKCRIFKRINSMYKYIRDTNRNSPDSIDITFFITDRQSVANEIRRRKLTKLLRRIYPINSKEEGTQGPSMYILAYTYIKGSRSKTPSSRIEPKPSPTPNPNDVRN